MSKEILEKYGITNLSEYNDKKRRSNELVYYLEWNGILLNLSYIYPNMALMCTPSASEIYKRNDIRIVSDFIHEKHGEHFYIINTHLQNYDISYFDNKVKYLPFPDHCSPKISYFENTCKVISQIFQDDPECTIFVHCKAGRGRSGTVIAAYKVYSHAVEKVDEAVYMVDLKRSPEQMAITIPSQLRFLHYFEYLCHHGPPKQMSIRINKIEFSHPFEHVMEWALIIGIPFEDKPLFRRKFDGHEIEFTDDLLLKDEFVICVFEVDCKNDVLRCQFNTNYMTADHEDVTLVQSDDIYKIHFDKMHLDGPHNRKTSKNFPDDFSMNVYFKKE